MSINTPLGDTLDGFYGGLLAGRSALSNWKKLDTSRIYSKVGADLSDYDITAKVKSFTSATKGRGQPRGASMPMCTSGCASC